MKYPNTTRKSIMVIKLEENRVEGKPVHNNNKLLIRIYSNYFN